VSYPKGSIGFKALNDVTVIVRPGNLILRSPDGLMGIAARLDESDCKLIAQTLTGGSAARPRVHRTWLAGGHRFFVETGEVRIPLKDEWALYVGLPFRATGEGKTPHKYPILLPVDPSWVPTATGHQEAQADPQPTQETDPKLASGLSDATPLAPIPQTEGECPDCKGDRAGYKASCPTCSGTGKEKA